MKILFVHNNFPAQFVHLAPALAARGHQVSAIGSPTARAVAGVAPSTYRLNRGTTPAMLRQAIRFEADCLRGLGAAQVAQALAARGYCPDLVFGHVGWGETLFLKELWPATKLALYAEMYIHARGYEVNFDPEFAADGLPAWSLAIGKNASQALCMAEAHAALSPTHFQRDSYPEVFRQKIEVAHDGIDTDAARPRPDARLVLPNGLTLAPGAELITHVNRSLEPLRGLHKFLRALPRVFAARPAAEAVIIGDAGGRGGYGAPPPGGRSWKEVFLEELGDALDLSRVHFLGRVPRPTYLDMLACSAAHVYFTYPFVLSWSMLEAMSAGCALIASDTVPVREMVTHGRTGLLVDFFDHDALSEAIIDTLSRAAAFREMRANARAHVVAQYSLTQCVERQADFVERV